MEKIRGVNLGNWLVLEKWMHPDLFAGVEAEDETDLCERLPKEDLKKRLTEHRDTYITLEDFKFIAARGLNTIRIPVPHFIFDDCAPYIGCIEYLDKAFDWAEESNLKILIDLHTAPDSQNGFDNGGICGVCKWSQSEENIQRTLDILENLAKRYKDKKALYGIQLLNEPISEELWTFTKNRYLPSDPKRAEGSSFVPLDVLYDFYTRGYHVLRKYLSKDKAIVFHDGFRLNAWDDFMKNPEFENVVLDVHLYMSMSLDAGNSSHLDNMSMVFQKFNKDVVRLEAQFPVIIGEWCLAHGHQEREEQSELEKMLSYRLVADAQLLAWEKCSGYFFWSYKLVAEVEGWDFKKCVEKGYMPDQLS